MGRVLVFAGERSDSTPVVDSRASTRAFADVIQIVVLTNPELAKALEQFARAMLGGEWS